MGAAKRYFTTLYEPDASLMFEAGLLRTQQPFPGRIDLWQGRHGLYVYAALDDRDFCWRFRPKRGDVVGPVFDRAEPLIAWLKVEGWL